MQSKNRFKDLNWGEGDPVLLSSGESNEHLRKYINLGNDFVISVSVILFFTRLF